MLYTSRYDSPLGGILLAGDDEALTGLWFDGQKYFADTLPAQHAARETPVFDAAKRWLDVYFRGERPDFTPPVKWEATPFRSAVWEILISVPYGTTITYEEIASRIARYRGLAHMSAQAAGSAVAHNPISVIVPCHRVVGTDGSLTGYAGGIGKKLRLLELERVDTSRFFIPKKGTAL